MAAEQSRNADGRRTEANLSRRGSRGRFRFDWLKKNRHTGSSTAITSTDDLDVICELGRGSFAKVLHVKARNTGADYALKVLDRERIVQERIQGQVLAERRIQELVGEHPFVVKLFSHWQNSRNLFFLMEYVKGGDLFDAVKKSKRFSAKRTGRYVLQIAQAMDFIHHHGIIYRDLKLENILLNELNDTIQLTDFGLAKDLQGKDTTRTICGTVQYMAPEILQGTHYNYKVDWWSLGVNAYVMLVGKYPFSRGEGQLSYNKSAADRLIMYNRISKNLLNIPDFVTPEAEQAIRRMLDASPTSRLCSRSELEQLKWFESVDLSVPMTKDNLVALTAMQTVDGPAFPILTGNAAAAAAATDNRNATGPTPDPATTANPNPATTTTINHPSPPPPAAEMTGAEILESFAQTFLNTGGAARSDSGSMARAVSDDVSMALNTSTNMLDASTAAVLGDDPAADDTLGGNHSPRKTKSDSGSPARSASATRAQANGSAGGGSSSSIATGTPKMSGSSGMDLFDLLSEFQGSRLDDQRSPAPRIFVARSLEPYTPGPEGNADPENPPPSPPPTAKGSPGRQKRQTSFFSLLAESNAGLEDQRSALAPPPLVDAMTLADTGPTPESPVTPSKALLRRRLSRRDKKDAQAVVELLEQSDRLAEQRSKPPAAGVDVMALVPNGEGGGGGGGKDRKRGFLRRLKRRQSADLLGATGDLNITMAPIAPRPKLSMDNLLDDSKAGPEETGGSDRPEPGASGAPKTSSEGTAPGPEPAQAARGSQARLSDTQTSIEALDLQQQTTLPPPAELDRGGAAGKGRAQPERQLSEDGDAPRSSGSRRQGSRESTDSGRRLRHSHSAGKGDRKSRRSTRESLAPDDETDPDEVGRRLSRSHDLLSSVGVAAASPQRVSGESETLRNGLAISPSLSRRSSAADSLLSDRRPSYREATIAAHQSVSAKDDFAVHLPNIMSPDGSSSAAGVDLTDTVTDVIDRPLRLSTRRRQGRSGAKGSAAAAAPAPPPAAAAAAATAPAPPPERDGAAASDRLDAAVAPSVQAKADSSSDNTSPVPYLSPEQQALLENVSRSHAARRKADQVALLSEVVACSTAGAGDDARKESLASLDTIASLADVLGVGQPLDDDPWSNTSSRRASRRERRRSIDTGAMLAPAPPDEAVNVDDDGASSGAAKTTEPAVASSSHAAAPAPAAATPAPVATVPNGKARSSSAAEEFSEFSRSWQTRLKRIGGGSGASPGGTSSGRGGGLTSGGASASGGSRPVSRGTPRSAANAKSHAEFVSELQKHKTTEL